MPAPSFLTYEYATLLMGGVPVKVPLREYTIDLDAMLSAITPRTKLVFLCNPNNPTGTIVTAEAVRSFLRQLPPHVLAVIDEAYFEYVQESSYPDGVALIQEGYRILVLRTFSKIYGLAGLRVGYAIGPTELLSPLHQVKEPFSVNLLGQVAALASLQDREQVERSREVNDRGMRYLMEELPKLGMQPIPSYANFLLFRADQATGPIYQGLLKRGVIIRPTDGFGLSGHLRVTVGTDAQNRRFMGALKSTLGEMGR